MQSGSLRLTTKKTGLTHPYTPCTDDDLVTAGVNITLCKAVYNDFQLTSYDKPVTAGGVPEHKSFGTERVSERNSQIVRNKSTEQMRDFYNLVLNHL